MQEINKITVGPFVEILFKQRLKTASSQIYFIFQNKCMTYSKIAAFLFKHGTYLINLLI